MGGLGSALPTDCRAIVYGTPALLHPVGIVFALAYGTAYAIRVSEHHRSLALEAGCRVEQIWSGGGKTDIEQELGRGWLFGLWINQEPQWVLDVYKQLV